MIHVRFATPVGDFIAVFSSKDEAVSAIADEVEFTGIKGEVIIIPVPVQTKSVIIVSEEIN